MARRITAVITRNSATLAGDALGGVALVVMLFVGLYMPALF
jgi:hypothetical protein